MDCSNSARISEAIKAVEKAVGLSRGGYLDRKAVIDESTNI